MCAWFSFGRSVHGELGRALAPGAEASENADVRPLRAPEGLEVACGQFHNLALQNGKARRSQETI